MLRELRSGLKDIAKLASLLDVLIVIGRNDGCQDTSIPEAIFVYRVNSVLDVPICVAEGSEDQRDFLGTAGDVVGGVIRVLN